MSVFLKLLGSKQLPQIKEFWKFVNLTLFLLKYFSKMIDHSCKFSGDSQVLQSSHKREVEFFGACLGNASTVCRHNWTPAAQLLEDFSDVF